MLTFLQREILFPRRLLRVDPGAVAGARDVERLSRPVAGGSVEAFFLPGHGAGKGAQPLVIFAHGNGELIDHWLDGFEPYRELGVHVLLVEYRGYGRSAGAPSEAAIREDFLWFYDSVVGRQDVDRDQVIFHGRSLGGGAVCGLARDRAPRAMVLESTFTSVSDMARSMGFPGGLVADVFDNLAAVGSVDVPLLLLHGRRDEVVPFRHAERLADAAPQATLLPCAGGHNDMPRTRAAFWSPIVSFLRKAGVAFATPQA